MFPETTVPAPRPAKDWWSRTIPPPELFRTGSTRLRTPGKAFEAVLAERARTRPVVVLTGARQTGKTALVRRVFPDHAYVSLDLPSEAEQAERDPTGFLARHPGPLVVDEVQYAPGLFRHLKRRVDERRGENGRFILTGSQAFPLMSSVAESLAGRAAVLTLGGLSHAEIARARPGVPIEEVLLRGGYPELHAQPEIDPRGFFQSYVATYLERDLRAQLQVGSLRDFERFLRAAALRTAQLLNRAELSRDVGISPSTAGQWLSVLERSGIAALLEPWFSNRTKSLVKTPKLHLHDTGLCAFLMGVGSVADLRESPLAGQLWETLVFSEIARLLATSSCTRRGSSSSRTRSGPSTPRDRGASSVSGRSSPARPARPSCAAAPTRTLSARA